ncbi:hypothetical protein [Candidatus Venteria ishoeyi]|uniref:Uncharacterized protein n=1 Tax=Candidatus Venteria ishoeyi TaxID=1899563 RepID=A0A1H6FH17_9GAMM|nr:hypothetical protein [Candidatus Venteria ishoeyi]SEH08953.1 Uncharacterised protein [Candidatus Venteria ishoeyi]
MRPLLLLAYFLFIPIIASAAQFKILSNTVTGGEVITLDVIEGTPPFLWIPEVGHITTSIDGDAYRFHLQTPEVEGLFSIQLRDSQGQQATENFSINWGQFSISPQYIYSKPGETHHIAIHDAKSTVKIVTEGGEWEWLPEQSGQGIQYVSPEKTGFYTITFSPENNPGNTRLAHIYVYPELKLKLNGLPVEGNKILYLEQDKNAYLEVQGGVPPYFWVEGGKGNLSSLEGDNVRYTPGNILGEDIIRVYDATGQFLDIPLYVKGDFYLNPQLHSICPPGAEVRFNVVGGEPEYFISPPANEGWVETNKTETSLKLKFDQAGFYEIVASDNTGRYDISRIEVKSLEQCDTELPITIDTSVQLPERVKNGGHPVPVYIANPPLIPALYFSIDKNDATITWECWTQNCSEQDFDGIQGNLVTFWPPKAGFYIINATSSATGENRMIHLHVSDSLFNLYAGPDYKLEETEIQYLLEDFFVPNINYPRTEIYKLIVKGIDK